MSASITVSLAYHRAGLYKNINITLHLTFGADLGRARASVSVSRLAVADFARYRFDNATLNLQLSDGFLTM
jgi:hypothetical protein